MVDARLERPPSSSISDGSLTELRCFGASAFDLPHAGHLSEPDEAVPQLQSGIAGRRSSDHRAEHADPIAIVVVHGNDWRADIVTDQRQPDVHPFCDDGVEGIVGRCPGVLWIEPCHRQRFRDVEIAITIVVDPGCKLPIRLERCVVTVSGPQRFHDPKHLVGLLGSLEIGAVWWRIVLPQKTDRLPRDVEVTLGLNNVDDPTGRHPAPRSNGVNPEINVHDFTVPCLLPPTRTGQRQGAFTMKAIQIHETGAPDVMSWTDVDEPNAGPGQVVVAVAAAGVNYIDTYHRSGLYSLPLPAVLGLEGAGHVIEIGSAVNDLSIGDAVAWSTGFGSYAERVALNASSVVPVPDGVDLETAAATMLQGMTAHYLVTDTHPLADGEKCLIHAGAGGVGLILIQLAKQIGAEVFTTVGTEEKEALARAAGADHVIRYRDVDFGEAIETIAGERPLAIVYDGVGQSVFRRSLDLLMPRGVMATFGNASGPVEPISPLDLAPSLFLTRPSLFHYISTRDELLRRSGELFDTIAAGTLDIRIGHRLPLAEAAEAHRMLEGRVTSGKVILTGVHD